MNASRAGALVAALLLGCAGTPKAPAATPPVPLHLEPACELAPSAGLEWIVDVKPRALAEVPDLIPALGLVLPEERLRLFREGHGGIDLRQVNDFCVARYGASLLSVARVPLDPERVAAAFETRSARPAPRTLLAPNPRVLRLVGEVSGEEQRLLLFGRDAAALEQGKAGPLRAAEAFAFGKLKRALPALRGAALARAVQLLGDAPVRVLAPGPFQGESGQALGGLLRASTAIGVSARPDDGDTTRRAGVAVRLVLTGAWGDDAPAASERLGAAVHVLSESAAGLLFGLSRPIRAPTVRSEPDALVLDAVYDGMAIARGVHDAVDADVADMMRK